MVNPRQAADDQREKAKELLVQLFEATGLDMTVHQYTIDLIINHIITAAMLEIAIAQKEAIDRAQNAR